MAQHRRVAPWLLALCMALFLLPTLGLAAGPAIDANHASEAQLDSVRGLGPGTTARILAARSKAPFQDWADFMARVPGMGPKRATQLAAQGLTVAGQGYGAAPAPARQSPASPAQ